MLTRYGQSRADGLSPMPRGSYSGQHLRVSDAERQAVTGRLSQHFGDGRLDQADSGERAGRTMSATSQACPATYQTHGLRHYRDSHRAGTVIPSCSSRSSSLRLSQPPMRCWGSRCLCYGSRSAWWPS